MKYLDSVGFTHFVNWIKSYASPQEIQVKDNENDVEYSISKSSKVVKVPKVLTSKQQERIKAIMDSPKGRWVLTIRSGAKMRNTADIRRVMTLDRGFGNIHLDIDGADKYEPVNWKDESTIPVIAELPDDAPTPIALYELMLWDGNTVYIKPGERKIYTEKLEPGRRYIFDIWGYFSY